VGVALGSNRDTASVGLQKIKDELRNQPANHGDLTKFKECTQAGEWCNFRSYHYDWWMFAIDRGSSGYRIRYIVYQNDIQQLKADPAWLQYYWLGAILLIQV
jgi:hypothetical protein